MEESLKHFSKKRKLSFAILFSFVALIINFLAFILTRFIFNEFLVFLAKTNGQVLLPEALGIAVLLMLLLIYIGMVFYKLLVNFNKLTKIKKIIILIFLFLILQVVLIVLSWVLIYSVPSIYKFYFNIK